MISPLLKFNFEFCLLIILIYTANATISSDRDDGSLSDECQTSAAGKTANTDGYLLSLFKFLSILRKYKLKKE